MSNGDEIDWYDSGFWENDGRSLGIFRGERDTRRSIVISAKEGAFDAGQGSLYRGYETGNRGCVRSVCAACL